LLIPPDDGRSIAFSIPNGLRTISVSDGSYKDTYGTAAWVITSPITSHSLSGQVIVPGSMDTHSSYRSELAGIYSSILISVKLCKFFDVQGGQITLACDSQSALDSVLRNNKCTPVDAPCFDLLGAIHCLCSSSNIQWIPFHVKGHQDEHHPAQELSDLEILNITMDKSAKGFMPTARSLP